MLRSAIALILLGQVASTVAFGEKQEFLPPSDSPAGRYQLLVGKGTLYFIDTATGRLWQKDDEGVWKSIDSPVSPALQRESRRKSNGKKTEQLPVSLTLKKKVQSFRMLQRESRFVPGSEETIWIHINDITSGQVLVELVDINGKQIVPRTSLKNNEYLKFKVNREEFYLQVLNMVNSLFGEDLCTIQLSVKKPQPDVLKDLNSVKGEVPTAVKQRAKSSSIDAEKTSGKQKR